MEKEFLEGDCGIEEVLNRGVGNNLSTTLQLNYKQRVRARDFHTEKPYGAVAHFVWNQKNYREERWTILSKFFIVFLSLGFYIISYCEAFSVPE